MSGLFSPDSGLSAVSVVPSPNHGPRPDGGAVTLLVLHYTGMRSGAEALARLCDPSAQVSAHYLVEEDGRIIQLVPESRRAWHAGRGFWRGCTDINSASIGVEIVNPGHEFGYRPFPAPQMAAVRALCRDILDRQPLVTPAGVVGHSDVAPARKEDPGELFDWPELAAAGIGWFPDHGPDHGPGQGGGQGGGQGAGLPDADVAGLLRQIGYAVEDVEDQWLALIAFQRRYRPRCFSGLCDAETLGLLRAVATGLKDRA